MDSIDISTRRQARIAQIFIALMALALALLYPVLPLVAHEVGQDMEVSHLVLPYSIAACLAVVAIHIFLFTVWRILGFIRAQSFYTMPVLRWVKVAKVAVIVGCFMPIAIGVHLLVAENAGGPLMLPFVFGMLIVGAAVTALLDVLVGLYRDASSHVAELAEVI